MKKIILYIATSVLLLGSLSSCSDFLKEETFGQPTASELLQDPDNVYRVVGQVYANLKWLQDHWTYFGLNTLSTDEGCMPERRCGGSDWADSNNWNTFNRMSWTADTEPLQKLWQYAQEGAVLCNNIITQLQENKEAITQTSDSVYNAAIAETTIVRTYYYYCLFDCFGRIPYTASFGESVTNNPLPTAAEVWMHLVKDLEDNVEAMPTITSDNRSSYYGRATKGLGYGLLSRLYLNAESFGVKPGANIEASYASSTTELYEKCIAYCDSVINSGSYITESSYFNNFLLENGNSQENIFVIVNDARNNFDVSEVSGSEMNKFRVSLLTHHYAFQYAYDMVDKPWNGLCATEEYMKLFEEGDVRGACSDDIETGGTKIDFTVDANKRGWFVGPIYYPDDYSDANLKGTLFYSTDRQLQSADCNFWTQEPYKSYYAAQGITVYSQAYVPAVIRKGITDCATWTGETYEGSSNDDNNVVTDPCAGARNMKYEIELNAATNNPTHQYGENDFVLMRYAEILYNKAEAAIRAGDDAALQEVLANSDFQNIRTRAGVAAYSSLDLDEILNERGREFSWELLRRRDLIRHGKFTGDDYIWTGKKTGTDSHYNWFPIPALYIQNSGGNWSQNEGY